MRNYFQDVSMDGARNRQQQAEHTGAPDVPTFPKPLRKNTTHPPDAEIGFFPCADLHPRR